jgi:hypothetical protein
MKAEPLRRAVQARPFRPFRLHLADGREIPVGHPENVTVTSDDRCVLVYIPGDGAEIVDVPLVTAIDFRRKRRGA